MSDVVSKGSKSKDRRRNLSFSRVAFGGVDFLVITKTEERMALRGEKEWNENVTVIF